MIVAAGRGHRAGGGLPKQYRDLDGEPVLSRTLRAFHQHPRIDTIMVVIHPDDQDLFNAANQEFSASCCYGGETRSQSVRNGLLALNAERPDHVLVHDAARPFVSCVLIERLCNALDHGVAAVPGLPMTDAMFSRDGDHIAAGIDRDTLVRVQTPQAFHFECLMTAFDGADAGISYPDEASLARSDGMAVQIVDGDPANIKLTFAEDFQMPASHEQMITVSGTGYDVHRLGPGDGVWLCGVNIPCPFELIGHSDADVGLHALVDALLGAIGAGDIGQHFPPSDPQWKGAASSAFVDHAVALARDAGALPVHADITLICEKPKIGPHRDVMKARIADMLGLRPGSVNIKATTTEGLGFAGRSEGIAAHAIVTVKRYE
ncbi:bifunctional 2-C-methyl-D-erythritol 4-phosphate cytidylyltransferase/2-C-methyl-D-erythritol 2,4-cyclodiphosphate synthase [Hyphobacterium sp.]|uniref:bifunctional 2-C-methyl-D-erythritol 4-phosphate cytidylyltransferase/2-C-methyl-D-erythritol 2,4-cyclodiphosphate synthase n=1 Tax=Hyphobacterium sp. TaxID=2004662 RepID=UPI00374A28D4